MKAKPARPRPSFLGGLVTFALALAAGAACSPRHWDVDPVVVPQGSGGGGGGGSSGGGAAGGATDHADAGVGGKMGSGGKGGSPWSDGSGGHDFGRGGNNGNGFPGDGGIGQCAPLSRVTTAGVLFLVDRSASTKNAPDGSDMPWWKAENDALNNAVTQYASTMTFAYRPFPASSPGCNPMDLWKAPAKDVDDQISSCMNGSCVQTTTDVPLSAALGAAEKDLDFSSNDPLFAFPTKPWVVILLGSVPGCPSCSNLSPVVNELANSRAATIVIPFGSMLDSNSCLLSIQSSTKGAPLAPAAPARDAKNLRDALAATMKEIQSETQCTFSGLVGPVSRLLVQIGDQQMDLPDTQGTTRNWIRDSYTDFRFVDNACQKISDGLAQNKRVTVTPISDSCNGPHP